MAAHLLEPQGPDSFVAWGFFDAIFEQKEYGEDYVVEKLARDMLDELRVVGDHHVFTSIVRNTVKLGEELGDDGALHVRGDPGPARPK